MDVYGLIVGHLDPGRRSYFRELQQQVEDRGLSDRITLTGRRDDMHNIYAVSDIILSLSNKPESFGRSVLEPLCMGRPAAGYAHGGVGEILAAIFPAGRVATGDKSALRDTVQRLLKQPQAVGDCGAYSRDQMLTETLALYRELGDA